MTQPEALQEARRRWGKDARVKRKNRCADFRRDKTEYRVYGTDFMSTGKGDSWEAAFADADRKVSQ
jgi:hypothetical protein